MTAVCWRSSTSYRWAGIQLTALWPGMAAPVVFLVNEWRLTGTGALEVTSGEGCPYVALLPTAEPLVLLAEQVAA